MPVVGDVAQFMGPGRWRKCACVLVHHNDPENMQDRCIAWTNADQPFCDQCERLHQHPHLAKQFGQVPLELLRQEEPVTVSANEEQP